MKIRLNKAHFPVTTLGYGRRLGLWVQGCSIGCEGCVSRDTWDATGGWDEDVLGVVQWCDSQRERGIDGITISGGEPFEQPRALARLLEALAEWRHQLDQPFDILCYSGFTLARLERCHAEVLALLDVLVPEPFVVGRGGPQRLRGSGNQTLIPLTQLGRVRYGDEAQFATGPPGIQVSVDQGAVWFIGIPNPGDMERLEERARSRGVDLVDVSWRA